MSDLSWTSDLMSSENYRQRFFAEYWQTKIRYERLKDYVNKIEASRLTGTKEPPHDCPERLLRAQQKAMGEYLHVLEVRAIIEDIDLQTTTLNIEEVNEDK